MCVFSKMEGLKRLELRTWTVCSSAHCVFSGLARRGPCSPKGPPHKRCYSQTSAGRTARTAALAANLAVKTLASSSRQISRCSARRRPLRPAAILEGRSALSSATGLGMPPPRPGGREREHHQDCADEQRVG